MEALVGQAKQQPVSAPGGCGLDLGEDSELLSGGAGAGRRDQATNLDRLSPRLQRPRARAPASSRGGASAGNAHSPAQQAVHLERVTNLNQRRLSSANRNSLVNRKSTGALVAGIALGR